MRKSIVATNVQKLIKERGLKQVYIAEQIGISPKDLSDMLNNRRYIHDEYIIAFAKIFGVSIDSLFKIE